MHNSHKHNLNPLTILSLTLHSAGKLHRHIVQLQVSEGTAVKKLEDTLKKVTKLQAQLLRVEQRLDEKDQALLHHRAESANKSRHLRYMRGGNS